MIKKYTVSRLSWYESILNVFSGLLLSVLIVQPIVFGIYGIELEMSENIGIATIFTVVSIVRGYVWRRWFHARFYNN